MATQKGIFAVFSVLQAAACRAPAGLDPAVAAATWAVVLGDIADEEIMQAVVAYVRGDCPFWPTPGQLLAMVPRRAVAAIDTADAAWGSLIALVGRHGSYDPPTLTGESAPGPTRRAVIRDGQLAVIEIPAARRSTWTLAEGEDVRLALEAGLAAVGGWRALCMLQDEDVTAARASFRAAYRAQGERQRIEGDCIDITRRIEEMRGKLLTKR